MSNYRKIEREDIIKIFPFSAIDNEVLAKCSTTLLNQLFYKYIINGLCPTNVLCQIEYIDGIKQTEPTETKKSKFGLKKPTKFKHFPLKNYWHAHYFDARYLPNNLMNCIDTLIDIFLRKSQENKKITSSDIDNIIQDRIKDNELTGEWIIYTKHEGKTYYLYLANHLDGDINIHKNLMEIIKDDFPLLPLQPCEDIIK